MVNNTNLCAFCKKEIAVGEYFSPLAGDYAHLGCAINEAQKGLSRCSKCGYYIFENTDEDCGGCDEIHTVHPQSIKRAINIIWRGKDIYEQ